ncbi:ATP-binding protein [Marinobacter sp.]|uniref:ATP-binding protein n=1 Tax=Marinobacter sp. TaxID=50741 RepID=UPI0019DDBAC1|nr:ATP-binding protein [Marinobacter sp.]MBE0486781.1 ATP-binding protein [Marinobacter sp.]
MALSIQSSETVASILQKIRDHYGALCLDNDRVNECYTIIDEFHSNIRAHVATKNDHCQWSLEIVCHDGIMQLEFEYAGPGFDPTRVGPVSDQPVESRPIGGLGLNIMAQLSDDMNYCYQDGVNKLTITLDTTSSREDDTCH